MSDQISTSNKSICISYCINGRAAGGLWVLLRGLGTGDEEQDCAEAGRDGEGDGDDEELFVPAITDVLQLQGFDIGIQLFEVKVVEPLLSQVPLARRGKVRRVSKLVFHGSLHLGQDGLLPLQCLDSFIPAGLLARAARAENEDRPERGQSDDEAADGQSGEVLAVDHRIGLPPLLVICDLTLSEPSQDERLGQSVKVQNAIVLSRHRSALSQGILNPTRGHEEGVRKGVRGVSCRSLQ